jgi:glycosyltransferase involved in cell wall biosynthesis
MPKTPLSLYTYCPQVHNASFWYRILTPILTARDLGLPLRVMMDRGGEVEDEVRVKSFCEADIILLYQPIGEPVLHNSRIAKSFLPSLRDGDWKYPPTLVIDTDDNLFHVSPFNCAYKNLGIKDPEGNEIPKGHVIGAIQNGQKKVLWRDGEGGFDVTRNRHNLQVFRDLVDLSDAVTCTVPHIADVLSVEASPRRVQTMPNLVRFDHYEQVDLREEKGKIKILWQGGGNHYEDFHPLREAMGEITRRYKQVHWVIWGDLYPWVMEQIPPDRYTFKSWCPYEEYKLRLAMIGHDISIAPLAPTPFNQCRSAIKFYESTVLKKPVATLAQATGPYKDEIEDGQTGLLFSTPAEFTQQLSRLIEDEVLRRHLAENAKDWVSENRDAMKKVPEWLRWLEQLREEIVYTQPHMPQGQWDKFVAAAQQEAKDEPAAHAVHSPS